MFTRYLYTSVAVAVAIIIGLAALIGDINLLEQPLLRLARIESSEIDEIITSFLLVIGGFIIDHRVEARRRKTHLQVERLRIVKVTMRTVQDVVNNCLNQMQLVRLEAEDHVSQESLQIFDGAVQEISAKLKKLGDLEAYTEHQMAIGVGLKA